MPGDVRTRRTHGPIKTPEAMLAGARALLEAGSEPQRLIDVAIQQRDKWARLAETEALPCGCPPDGRASIYSGETYAEARDRWEAYRVLLLEELRGTHGGC